MKKVNCSTCKKEIDKIDMFPKGLCIDCHEIEFNKQDHNNEKEFNNMVNTFKDKGINKVADEKNKDTLNDFFSNL